MTYKVALAIPTFNAGSRFEEVLKEVYKQKEQLALVKIYDSESNDDTTKIVKKYGFEVSNVLKKDFSHSATRSKIAKEMYEQGFDYLILMTQDVYLQSDAIKLIIEYIIHKPSSGVVYGKQEVDMDKGSLNELYSRKFNYGQKNLIKSKSDIKKLGIKTIFNSDAFAIYNLKIVKEVGYFGNDATFGEDMIIADKFIQKGYTVGYCCQSKVFHTHNYTLLEEFNRYKIIGEFHKLNKEMIGKYGKTNSEGLKLAISEIKYLIDRKKMYKIPDSLIRNIAKYLGFKLGFMRG